MKKLQKALKRAFTITELVIVIAVIAILAAVLIPTFSNVIENANQSAAMQNCRAAISDYGTPEAGLVVSEGNEDDEYYYLYMNGGIHLLDGVTEVTAATTVVEEAMDGAEGAVTFTVRLEADGEGTEPADWASHELTLTSGKGIEGVYMSKPVTINGTNYVSVFVRQIATADENDPLTNFYSTAYIYSGTFFSWNPETNADIAMTATFTATVAKV